MPIPSLNIATGVDGWQVSANEVPIDLPDDQFNTLLHRMGYAERFLRVNYELGGKEGSEEEKEVTVQ